MISTVTDDFTTMQEGFESQFWIYIVDEQFNQSLIITTIGLTNEQCRLVLSRQLRVLIWTQLIGCFIVSERRSTSSE